MLRGDSDLRYYFVPLFQGPVGVKKQLWTAEVKKLFAHTFISKLLCVQSHLLLFHAQQSLFQALEQGQYSRNKESLLHSPVSLL